MITAETEEDSNKDRECELVVMSATATQFNRLRQLIEDGYDIDTAVRVNDSTVHYVLIRYKAESWRG